MYIAQCTHCFICHPSDSYEVRRTNHSDRSHQQKIRESLSDVCMLRAQKYTRTLALYRCSLEAQSKCTLQRQNTEISKQIVPEKEYRGLSPKFHIHASVSDVYISTIGLPILLEEICRPILGLYKSLTDT